jgi:hypothetical protein
VPPAQRKPHDYYTESKKRGIYAGFAVIEYHAFEDFCVALGAETDDTAGAVFREKSKSSLQTVSSG